VQDNPWLRIPADDYEAHMSAVGQSQALDDAFSRVYGERRPARLAVLGCSTGRDFEQVDPTVTEVVVGVDINSGYLELARRRAAALGPRLHLVCADVLEAKLPSAPYDLVHAALLLEYVEPASLLGRIFGWLSPGGACSLITQEPVVGVAAVSRTGYESLQGLSGHMSLRSAHEVAALAADAGLELVSTRVVSVLNGKRLVSALFERARGSAS
jgi:ubiquinone/menaquinone biosynthesis C-methylase UbiE